MKGKGILPLLLIGGAVYLVGYASTRTSLQRLKFSKPRLKIKRVGVTNADLEITLDIENPSAKDIALDYFTGDVVYNSSKLSSFTFTGGGNVILKARQIATVPFTVTISNIAALATLVKLVKALATGASVPTSISINGSIYAGGFDYPIAFSYDVKSNTVAGIGKRGGRRLFRKKRRQQPVEQQPTTSPYPDDQQPVSGIGSVKATLEFGSNQELEKYFANKRLSKKILFSKN